MKTAETENNNTADTRNSFVHAGPLDVRKRIGSTVYYVKVYVKNCAAETVEDKILRLVKNDLNLAPSLAKMDTPQTGRLPERSSA